MALVPVDPEKVARCRALAASIAGDVQSFIDRHTSVGVERTVARAFGVTGADPEGTPLANALVDRVHARGFTGVGVSYFLGRALAAGEGSIQEAAESLAYGAEIAPPGEGPSRDAVVAALREPTAAALARIDGSRDARQANVEKRGQQAPPPLKYVIVATGNIHDDAVQAKAAAFAGADIVAVIRATAQSLLDFVPEGPTTEGYGGTYATQENFRIVRQALDEIADQTGRYVQQTNYSSGLCMSEIAWMAAVERLDMLLNDAMYGILFRDINMRRTFVDQYFSRRVIARSGIVINTGEDNYLTTADAVEQAHTVLASQFVNEAFALRAGLGEHQMGLGHAFEIDPWLEDSFLFEVAQAQLVRQIFDRHPIKWMPPTKFKTGDIFHSHVHDAMFNLVGVMTGQSIELLGMFSEAIHTPLLMDRYLAIKGAKYVFGTARHLGDEIQWKPGGIVERRATDILDRALTLLGEVERETIWDAIGRGAFADVKRTRTGGKGHAGVVSREPGYLNPILDALEGFDPMADEPEILRAYGDREGDGMVQMAFTLKVLPGDRAREAAKRFAEAHGLKDPLVTAMEQASPEHTYFVAYGHSVHGVDLSAIHVEELGARELEREDIELKLSALGRKVVIVGACTGSDAHTVGIDAIINYKGFHGEKGLESYKGIDAHNLGAQVENDELCARARALGADAVLVSQVITQRNCHKENAAALVRTIEGQGWRDDVILLLGGPRIDNKLARELGFDGGFGPGTVPRQVAAFVAVQMEERASAPVRLKPR